MILIWSRGTNVSGPTRKLVNLMRERSSLTQGVISPDRDAGALPFRGTIAVNQLEESMP